VKRGEVWTASGAPDYGGKPRPVVIIQNDAYRDMSSITVCPFTSEPSETALRLMVEPSPGNGLFGPSRLMIDKVATFPKSKLGKHIGTLGQEDLGRMDRALLVFLGLQLSAFGDEA
jgi:mRNA interferase MazF